ncbi:Ig-like domain-containing protein [Lactococcus lactis]|uniref:adhesive domain-containing protein n=1 Tax=Lactococcus lactis TaxID=1358 RepID=UPI001BAAF110|nr:adhesive domain-containing protein [Lactococcus lactis]MBR8674000.1 LPXTG cell wall anchor domain-containing protein [Lactococcus lactis subsp. lactis]MBR8676815.1 LPXTG cell wall anchor domain-containing protein [Lactococcus lactis subsp. lactis]MBR8684398.1 LPXTG cell wall anchor domain-containing protein [Lactococcus lactis subsp. lactis]MCH5424515.1 Ig-like domain-containing protein [Lactococcus lactis]MCH5426594.1 Ig-like domain-containing protein [Lactococcus lactis]
MEMQKQKPPRKKNKIITKRKVLSATMSGTLLMTSVVIPTAYSLLSNQITAQAAALNIDLLQNITSSNNSGTSTTNRWTSNSGSHNVDFTISGGALANISVLPGTRYATLVVPPELRGYVAATGNTSVSTNITIDFNKVALITAIVNAGDTLISDIAPLLSSNPLVTLNLAQVTQQLNLLRGIQDIGGATFTSTTTLSNENALLSAPLDDGVGHILSLNVKTILQNLETAVNNLNATGPGAIAVNAALTPLKLVLNGAIDDVLLPLTNGTGNILDLLLNVSALGDTTITIPTKITAPTTIQSDIDAKFVGSAVQTTLLDVNILSGANGISYVYLAGDVNLTLVAPTGDLTATTSAVGAADASATLPTTLKNSAGADIPVTSKITNASGTAVTNGQLTAGAYTVTYSATGYDDVTQSLVVSDPADTTAPSAPVVNDVTGNSTNGYTVTGTAEPGSTVTVKDETGTPIGTGTAGETGDYSVTLPGSVGPNAPLTVTATDEAGNESAPTSAVGSSDATATLPTTLKNSAGADISVTSKITNNSGIAVTNGQLSKGTYKVIYSASGYKDVTQNLVVSDPADTTAPEAPSVDTITGNTDTGYTVGGKGEPGSTITIKNPATGEVLGTTIVDKDGNYSIKLPMGVKPGTQLSATATDAAGNISDPTDFIIPVLTSGMAIGNSGDNMGGKYFSSGKLPATNGADTGWLGVIGTVILSLLGSLLFWRKNKKEDES